MRRIHRLRRLAALLLTPALAAGCVDFLDGGFNSYSYAIRVDSVTGPTAFSGAAPATVFVWATVGGDGCHRFVGFDTARTSAAQLDVSVVGRYERRGSDACTGALPQLRGQPLTIAPPITRPFLLVIRQPNGTTLTRTLQGE